MQILNAYHRPCLVGIGGISMSALAEMLHSLGFQVQGCDWKENAHIVRLRELGIPITLGPNDASHIAGADVVIRTAAAHDDAPEIAAARAAGIPVLERAAAWSDIMKGYENVLCVSGTHGKSSTTGLCTSVGLAAGWDPTVSIGADMQAISGNLHIGDGRLFVAEADEYYNSFLNFPPTVAIINNIEMDHPDFYADVHAVIHSFSRFLGLLPEGGTAVVNGENPNVREAVEKAKSEQNLRARVLTFGLEPENDITAKNVEWVDGCARYTLLIHGEEMGQVVLHVPGIHYVYNSMAAAAACQACGIPMEAILRGIDAYTGIERRFQYKGTCRGAAVYDDYAHHPTEMKATLTAARRLRPKRLIVAFQPHTYSRTMALFDEFAEGLRLADQAVLVEIYPAREQQPEGVTSKLLADAVDGAVFTDTLQKTADYLREIASPGDIIITMGAGDVTEISEMLTK